MKEIKNVEILPGAKEVGLFLSGSAASRNVLYTCEELELLEKPETLMFSVFDNHGEKESRDIEEGHGIFLSSFLSEAGARNVEEIKTKSIDGFESIVTEMRSKRYYFPGLKEENSDGRERREELVSFFKNGKKVKFYPHPTIMFGQQGLEDKNKDFFAKGIKAVIAGGKDRAFWVKGDGIRCNRYFSLDQLFELDGTDTYRAQRVKIEKKDGVCMETWGVTLPKRFWEEVEQTDLQAVIRAVSAEGTGQEIPDRETCWLFFTDESKKHLGFYDGEHVMENFAGIQIGEISQAKNPKILRVPQTDAANSDFYIRVLEKKQEIARYDYSFEELRRDFADLMGEEEYYYYNHNMNAGRGGNRLVTTHGWYLAGLLECLPQIPDREFLESGAVLFQVFTRDTYKEKIALEGNELTAYQFMLAYEQDQRTETGVEQGDTSAWADAEKCFAPIGGNTVFRIYCKKSSANPAVYKNVEGITVELL